MWAMLLLLSIGFVFAGAEIAGWGNNENRVTVFASWFSAGILIVALLQIFAAWKQRRSNKPIERQNVNANMIGRISAIGGAFSGLIMLIIAWITGASREIIFSALSGILSGFLIAVALAAIVKLAWTSSAPTNDT